ncbi:hypothetical protein THASP1DRAFT_30947, partial [Thamnocephalis sphaerospora]
DVTVEEIFVPLGSWGGRVGELFLKNFQLFFAGMTPFFVTACGMTEEEVKDMLEKIVVEFSEHQAHVRFRVFVGRKL